MRAGLAAVLALLGSAASAQMIGEDLAEVEAAGCTMPETALVERFLAEGFDISDYQAQVISLMRGGHLVAGDREGELRLMNWGNCS